MKFESDLYFCGDDLMQRGVYAQNIMSIIKNNHSFPRNNDNKSYVIGVNAPWGSGKTYFMQMLYNYLKGRWEKPSLEGKQREEAIDGTGVEAPSIGDSEFNVIYYDAWKNDFWNNAFEPLFDSLIQAAPILTETLTDDQKEIRISVAKIVALGIKGVISKKIDDYIDSESIDEINKELEKIRNNAANTDYQAKETFPEYHGFKMAIEKLRSYISEAVKGKELVIIVDELDRCKPTFAVQTLEIVKHLFNIEGLVFIFALDINQLSHSVKVVYGNEFDAIGYLERFFNYLTILPHGRLSSEIQAVKLIERMGLKSAFSDIDIRLIQRFIIITDLYGLSLREVKTVLTAYSILLNTVLAQYSNCQDAMILYFYFLCMKYKKPVLFSNGVFKNQSDEVFTFLSKQKIPFIECDDNYYLTAIELLTTNDSIGELKYNILSNGKIQYDRWKNNYLVHVFEVTDLNIKTNGDVIQLNEGISLSSLLFLPDIKRLKEINKYTILELIYRQLEMCDFIREPRKETAEQCNNVNFLDN